MTTIFRTFSDRQIVEELAEMVEGDESVSGADMVDVVINLISRRRPVEVKTVDQPGELRPYRQSANDALRGLRSALKALNSELFTGDLFNERATYDEAAIGARRAKEAITMLRSSAFELEDKIDRLQYRRAQEPAARAPSLHLLKEGEDLHVKCENCGRVDDLRVTDDAYVNTDTGFVQVPVACPREDCDHYWTYSSPTEEWTW